MLNVIRYAFWGIVAVCLIVVGLANRGTVTLRAMPEGLAAMVGISPDIELPLFVVIFLGVAVGLMIGFLWEWLREHQIRAESRARAREVADLQREVGRLRSAQNVGKDEVLALLEAPVTRR